VTTVLGVPWWYFVLPGEGFVLVAAGFVVAVVVAAKEDR
jgi:hypothetical protein